MVLIKTYEIHGYAATVRAVYLSSTMGKNLWASNDIWNCYATDELGKCRIADGDWIRIRYEAN